MLGERAFRPDEPVGKRLVKPTYRKKPTKSKRVVAKMQPRPIPRKMSNQSS
jgi:hypothetical protein